MAKRKDNMNKYQESSDLSDNDGSYINDNCNSLTVNELKSRLVKMNVDIDSIPRPKKYYLEKYNEAINDPYKREIIKKNFEEDKNKSSRREKKSNDFTKNKRKRSEEENMQNFEDNMTSVVDNINYVKESSNIKNMTINLNPVPQTPENNYKLNINNNSGYISTPPRQSSEKKIIAYNVKTHSINLKSTQKTDTLYNQGPQNAVFVSIDIPIQGYSEENNKPDFKPINSKNHFSNRQVPLNSSMSTVSNYREVPIEAPKPYVRVNSAVNLNNSSSPFYKDNNPQIKRVNSGQIYGTKMDLSFERSDLHHSPSPNYGSNIHRQVSNTQKSFKSPNQNQVFLNEIKVATSPRASSQSLNNRMLVINSINSTQLPDQSGQGIGNSSPFISNDPKNLMVSLHFSSVNEKIQMFLIGFGSAILLGSVYYLIKNINYDVNPIQNLITNNPASTKTLIVISVVALGVIAFLIRENWLAKQRTHKIIAENSVQEIKDHLINKDESAEVFENEFTDNYCLHNKESVRNYRNNILPYIRSMIQTDDVLEEAYVMREGSQRCVWRLKSSQI